MEWKNISKRSKVALVGASMIGLGLLSLDYSLYLHITNTQKYNDAVARIQPKIMNENYEIKRQLSITRSHYANFKTNDFERLIAYHDSLSQVYDSLENKLSEIKEDFEQSSDDFYTSKNFQSIAAYYKKTLKKSKIPGYVGLPLLLLGVILSIPTILDASKEIAKIRKYN